MSNRKNSIGSCSSSCNSCSCSNSIGSSTRISMSSRKNRIGSCSCSIIITRVIVLPVIIVSLVKIIIM